MLKYQVLKRPDYRGSGPILFSDYTHAFVAISYVFPCKAQSICRSRLSPADCSDVFILLANNTIAVTITPSTATRTAAYSNILKRYSENRLAWNRLRSPTNVKFYADYPFANVKNMLTFHFAGVMI